VCVCVRARAREEDEEEEKRHWQGFPLWRECIPIPHTVAAEDD
jgi:hypothetical protein